MKYNFKTWFGNQIKHFEDNYKANMYSLFCLSIYEIDSLYPVQSLDLSETVMEMVLFKIYVYNIYVS